jgi:hypothetical protein
VTNERVPAALVPATFKLDCHICEIPPQPRNATGTCGERLAHICADFALSPHLQMKFLMCVLKAARLALGQRWVNLANSADASVGLSGPIQRPYSR